MKMIKFIQNIISGINEKVGTYIACWLILPLIAVVVYEVASRYFFGKPTGWAYDMIWMLYAALIFLGGAYTLLHEGHVKVDIISGYFPARVRGLVNSICYLVLFFPMAYVLMKSSFDLMYKAWVFSERSPYALWKPLTGPIKTILFIGLLLLLLQGIVDFIDQLKVLAKGENNES